MFNEFTSTTEAHEMFNAIFALPSIADATLIYGVAWLLVMPPFLLAWGASRISKAIKLIGN